MRGRLRVSVRLCGSVLMLFVPVAASVAHAASTAATNGTSASAVSPVMPVMNVWLDNRDASMTRYLASTRTFVAELFHRAGVHITWVSEAAAGATREVTVTLAPSPDRRPTSNGGAETLGFTLPGQHGARSTTARVLSDRVSAYAEAHRINLAELLACVVAHELGHLLLPVSAHAQYGLMQPVWSPRLFPPFAPGLPGFLPWQATLLQRRLSDVSAN